ncbi:MAG TPA: hypothetical protein VFS62_16735, partial [Chloroflexota bacterium]|nr:hypothetical protein [Chloroflexota bacterium]
FQAISRVLAINGAVGAILWGVDQVTGRDNETLLQIRSNLPLTLFVAALIALAYGVARMAAHLDPERPFRNAAQLVLILAVIVAVTSMAGPFFVAVGEAGALLLLLLVLRLRHWQGNAYLVLRIVLIGSAGILLGGLGSGIATGQLLETRFSLEAVDGFLRLLAFLLGLSVYFLEEHRYWWSSPPTPVVVEQLQRACMTNDFAFIHRWLGDDLTFSQADQRMMGDLILPRRLVVDGDVAIVPDTSGDLLFFRVDNGRVAELRVFEPKIGR